MRMLSVYCCATQRFPLLLWLILRLMLQHGGFMNTIEFVQVSTQIITALTAVVMAYFAYQTYLKAPEQESESEPECASDEDAPDSDIEILVFKTSKQKTWLSLSPQGLECRIDDVRTGKGGHQWTLSRTAVEEILLSKSYHVNSGYKVNSGTFTLGPKETGFIQSLFFRKLNIYMVY
jgi:hypothetical protein